MSILAFNLLNPIAFQAEAGNFYVSTSAGVLAPNKISSTTVSTIKAFPTESDPDTLISVPYTVTTNHKIKPAFLFAAGIGYHVTEDLRVEVEYMKPFIKDVKSTVAHISATISSSDLAKIDPAILAELPFTLQENTSVNIPADLKVKPNINALYFKLYYDALKINDSAKIYLGAGLGVSAIQNKYVGFNPVTKESISEKEPIPKINFTYLAAIGASYDITENIAMSIEYNYIDFGKSHYDQETNIGGKKFAGSAGIVKLRFSF